MFGLLQDQRLGLFRMGFNGRGGSGEGQETTLRGCFKIDKRKLENLEMAFAQRFVGTVLDSEGKGGGGGSCQVSC